PCRDAVAVRSTDSPSRAASSPPEFAARVAPPSAHTTPTSARLNSLIPCQPPRPSLLIRHLIEIVAIRLAPVAKHSSLLLFGDTCGRRGLGKNLASPRRRATLARKTAIMPPTRPEM